MLSENGVNVATPVENDIAGPTPQPIVVIPILLVPPRVIPILFFPPLPIIVILPMPIELTAVNQKSDQQNWPELSQVMSFIFASW